MELRVPNFWYRIAYSWTLSASGPANYVCGVSIPGAPSVVIGSNGHIVFGLNPVEAWGLLEWRQS